MKLGYQQPKGSRLKRYFTGVYAQGNDYWYNCDLKRWEHKKNEELVIADIRYKHVIQIYKTKEEVYVR